MYPPDIFLKSVMANQVEKPHEKYNIQTEVSLIKKEKKYLIVRPILRSADKGEVKKEAWVNFDDPNIITDLWVIPHNQRPIVYDDVIVRYNLENQETSQKHVIIPRHKGIRINRRINTRFNVAKMVDMVNGVKAKGKALLNDVSISGFSFSYQGEGAIDRGDNVQLKVGTPGPDGEPATCLYGRVCRIDNSTGRPVYGCILLNALDPAVKKYIGTFGNVREEQDTDEVKSRLESIKEGLNNEEG